MINGVSHIFSKEDVISFFKGHDLYVLLGTCTMSAKNTIKLLLGQLETRRGDENLSPNFDSI